MSFLEYMLRPKGSGALSVFELILTGAFYALVVLNIHEGHWFRAALMGVALWTNWVQQQRRVYYLGLLKGSSEMAEFAKGQVDGILDTLKSIQIPRTISKEELDQRMAPEGVTH